MSYALSSSGEGRDGYAQGALQYGASDIIYYSEDGSFQQLAENQHPFKYVTVSAGGLAFAYNVVINGQRFTGLNLTSKQACQIFTGQITMWSQLAGTPGDSALASVNLPIHPVVRSDAAGESYVFSQYCIAVDPGDWATFQNFVDGPGQTPNSSDGWQGDTDMAAGKPVEYWPPFLSQSGGNQDVALQENGAPAAVNAVQNPANGFTIAYMAASYALTNGIPMASVQNSAGNFVQPNANTVQIALSYAHLNSLGTFDLAFTGSNPDAYFPSTYSYVLAPTTTNAPASAGADATLAQFLCYAVGAGQNDAPRLLYAPLSAEVTALSINAINSIPYPGGAASQLVPNCGQGGPAPPVSAPGVVTIIPNAPGAPNGPGTSGGPAAGGPTATNAPGGVTATTVGSAANSAAIGSNVAHPSGTSPSGLSGNAAAGSTGQPCASTTTSTTSTTSTTLAKKGGTTTTTLAKKGGTTTTTLAKKGGTTTTTPLGKTTTTTIAKKGATTTSSTSSTTSTTLCISPGGVAGKGASGIAGSNGSPYGGQPGQFAGSPTSVQLVENPSSSTATNSQAYWYLLVGAAVCAVGVGTVELRRRPAK